MASPRILNQKQNKKQKNTENQKLNPSRRWKNPITSHRHWHRDQTPIQKQTKHRELQQTKHRAQRCLSKKKKKKSPILSNTQTKTKPSNPRMVTSPSSSPQLARRRHHRHHLPGRPSSQIVDRRSENADRFASAPTLGARRSVHSPALPQGISLFFSLTLS